MEERLVKVETVMEAAVALVLGVTEGLVLIHLSVTVKVGPSLFIRQNLQRWCQIWQKWSVNTVVYLIIIDLLCSKFTSADHFSSLRPTSYAPYCQTTHITLIHTPAVFFASTDFSCAGLCSMLLSIHLIWLRNLDKHVLSFWVLILVRVPKKRENQKLRADQWF